MRITETMRAFISGESPSFREQAAGRLLNQWATVPPGALSSTFQLLWSGFEPTWSSSVESLIVKLIGEGASLDSCHFEKWNASVGIGGEVARSFRGVQLIECNLESLDLRKCNFSGAWLESVNFTGCNLANVSFSNASLIQCDVSGANLVGAHFDESDKDIYLVDNGKEYIKDAARGFLAHRGAVVGDVAPIFIARAHESYEIARKIARRMLEGGQSQVLGLTQRGAATKDPKAARKFVEMLVAVGFASFDKSGSAQTVETTAAGRIALMQLAEETALDPALLGFFGLRANRG